MVAAQEEAKAVQIKLMPLCYSKRQISPHFWAGRDESSQAHAEPVEMRLSSSWLAHRLPQVYTKQEEDEEERAEDEGWLKKKAGMRLLIRSFLS